MTLLAQVIDHLKAGALGFKAVEPIETLADLETVMVARPACFVLPATDDYLATQEGTGLINIEHTERFDVVVMVDAATRLGQRQDELRALVIAARERLFGWTPDGTIWRPMVPEAGRLTGVGGGRASFLTRFRTVSRIRKTGVI
jgi:hypothetical protein